MEQGIKSTFDTTGLLFGIILGIGVFIPWINTNELNVALKQLRAILCKYGASYIGTISRSDSDFDETC